MAMNRAQFRKQLQLGLNAVFGMAYRDYPEQWRQVFDVESSQKAYEEDVLMTGLGAAQVKAEGKGVAYDQGSEAWVQRYFHQTIALAFQITEEAVEDGLYGDLGAKYAKALARSMQHTKEVFGANVLNNAFDTNYAIGDGVAMCSVSHPLTAGGVASNTLATPAELSEAALEDALIQISQQVDDRGIPIALTGQKLIIAPANTFVAERITQSPYQPGTNNNDINAMRSMGKLPQGTGVLQRLTNPAAWFIKTDSPDGLKHFVRKPLSRGMEGDFESGNMRYKARERYSFGITDWRAIFGSSGG